MPTPIERSYLMQGYRLPDGLTWKMVAERRALWGISPIFVPVAVAPGCVGAAASVILRDLSLDRTRGVARMSSSVARGPATEGP